MAMEWKSREQGGKWYKMGSMSGERSRHSGNMTRFAFWKDYSSCYMVWIIVESKREWRVGGFCNPLGEIRVEIMKRKKLNEIQRYNEKVWRRNWKGRACIIGSTSQGENLPESCTLETIAHFPLEVNPFHSNQCSRFPHFHTPACQQATPLPSPPGLLCWVPMTLLWALFSYLWNGDHTSPFVKVAWKKWLFLFIFVIVSLSSIFSSPLRPFGGSSSASAQRTDISYNVSGAESPQLDAELWSESGEWFRPVSYTVS